MGSKTSAGEVLEPLSVYDENGVRFDPEPVAEPSAPPSTRELARGCVEAVRDVLAERSEVRTTAPWRTNADVPESRPRAATFYTTFSRMIELQPSRLPGLPSWWRTHARDGRLRVTRRLSLELPQPAPAGTWRAPGRMRSPFLRRSVQVELLLWPYLGSWTRMSLEPQRAVHTGKRYFRRGHRSLDRLTERLVDELGSAATGGPIRSAS